MYGMLIWLGFGYHGDFITGWETNFLQSAINTCTNPSGRIQDCPLFNVVDEGKATSCQMRKSPLQALFAENVLGPMAKLPGNIEVGGSASHGPAPAKSSPGPNLTYRPGEKPSDPAAPLPGQAFKEKAKSGSSAPTPPPPPPPPASTSTVVTPAPPPPADPPTFYSTQYITSGTVVKKILWVESVVTVTDFGGQPAEATPAAAALAGHKHRRHAARHAHVHGKF